MCAAADRACQHAGVLVCVARSPGILIAVTRPIDVPAENPRSTAAPLPTGAPESDGTFAWVSTTHGLHGIKVTGAAEIELARCEEVAADRSETFNALSHHDEPPPPRVTFQPPTGFAKSVLAAWRGVMARAIGSIRENARALPSSR